MRRIRDDLWETRTDRPFEGLTTHAYLWTGGPFGNVLFYAPATDADFDAMEELGGVAHQYLSHRDEAGPGLALVRDRFGARFHAPAAEAEEIARHRPPDVLLDGRGVDANGVEVVPTPGHSPGSTCYVVPGAGGAAYLFTGDTLYVGRDERWWAGFIPGISDAEALEASLGVLAGLHPDLVVSSAYTGTDGAHPVDPHSWRRAVEEAAERLRAGR